MDKLKVMDLFAGAGGLSNGFEQTGKFKVKVAVEINDYARETYKRNHENDVILHKDITQLEYVNNEGEQKPEYKDIDVIIGGPPCQGFSNANRQQNTLISSNNQLVREFIRAIEELKPKAFVMENVRTLESEKHKFYLNDKDEAELKRLNIEPSEEHIKIGYRNSYSGRLKDFLFNAHQKKIDLKPYMVNKELLSKLNSLLKHARNQSNRALVEFINKETNQKYFTRIINNHWQESHQEYWDNLYHLDWADLGEMLKNLIEKNDLNLYDLKSRLEEIVETQKVINKISEIIQNHVILYDIKVNEHDFQITIKSFNVFNYIKRKFSDLGYNFNEDQYIFNAARYGVPQERRRLILMGVRKDSLKAEKVITPKPLFSNKEDFYKIYDAIGDLEKLAPNTDVKEDEMDRGPNTPILGSPLNEYLNNNCNQKIYNHVRTESRDVAVKRFQALKEGQNFHDLEESLKTTYTDHSRTQNTIYRRLSYSQPADTVVNVRKSMWIHPVKDRAISIREAARLQSFQDSYKFFGSKDSQYQQIGNAVPPILARCIAEGLLESLGIKLEVNTKDIILPKQMVNTGKQEVH
ncbi:DNA cytosine methyltransferase [Bacillus sp. JJ1474]|uniref:DNA cytosine methyltransferase n=1 Tax=Bacillus sp. JJ1474 TaxID=3122955 RepID=UPI002FFD91E4